MNTLGLILALAVVASASIIPHAAIPASVAVRAPSHDSAIIQSHRLGGNFAYRTDEAHAYAVKTPVLGHKVVPVGVSYLKGTPIVKTSTDYVSHLVPQTVVATYQAPAQVISQPIIAKQPVRAVYAPAAHAAYAPVVKAEYAPASYAYNADYAPAVHAANYAKGAYASGDYAHALPYNGGVYAQGAYAPSGYAQVVPSNSGYGAVGYTRDVPSTGAYAHGAYGVAGYVPAVKSTGAYAHVAAGYAYATPSTGIYNQGAYGATGYAHAVPSAGIYAQGVHATRGYAHAAPSAGIYAHALPASSAYIHGLTGYPVPDVAAKDEY